MGHNTRFMPGIFDVVNRLRLKENVKTKKSDPLAPRIRNQMVLEVPSEDIGTQQVLQDKMRRALDTMHTTLVDDISTFIDHKVPDLDWLTSPTNFNLITSKAIELLWDKFAPDPSTTTAAPLNPAILAFMKLLAYFSALAETGQVSESMYRKAQHWWQDAQPVLREMKMGIRDSSKIDPIKYPKTIPSVAIHTKLVDGMRDFRVSMTDKTKKRSGVITSQPGWTSSINSLFTSLMTNFNSGTEKSFENIHSKVSLLNDPDLIKLYHIDDNGKSVTEANEHLNTLRDLVKSHGGKGHLLTPEQAAKLAKSPDKHKEYSRIKTKALNSVKAALKQYVRDYGKPILPADKALEFYTKNKFPHTLPAGFNGQNFGLDEDGNQYFKGVRIKDPTIGGWIKGNPLYDPKTDNTWLVRSQGDGVKDPKTIRSYQWNQVGKEEKKKGHIEHNKGILPEAMATWRSHLEDADPKKRELAHMVELLYKSSARIGSERGNTDGEQTFGISSLQGQHFKKNADGSITLKYKGKKGMLQEYTLKPSSPENKKLLKFIISKAKNKGDNDWLFTVGNSNSRITDSSVRTYMKDHLNWSGGPHKLRSLHGTDLFEKLAKRNPPPKNPNQKEMVSWWKAITTKVGNELGHKRTKDGKEEPTGTTAAQSYIDKDAQREYFKKAKIRIPSMIA